MQHSIRTQMTHYLHTTCNESLKTHTDENHTELQLKFVRYKPDTTMQLLFN